MTKTTLTIIGAGVVGERIIAQALNINPLRIPLPNLVDLVGVSSVFLIVFRSPSILLRFQHKFFRNICSFFVVQRKPFYL